MARIRTAHDAVRLRLAKWRNALLNSDIDWPTRDVAVRLADPTFEEILVHVTDDDLRAISDHDLLMLDMKWRPGNEDALTGAYLLSLLPQWDPDDVFFTEVDDMPASATVSPSRARSGRGRPPGSFWPELAVQFAALIYDEKFPKNQAEMIERLRQRLVDVDVEVGGTTVQSVVSRFWELTEDSRRK